MKSKTAQLKTSVLITLSLLMFFLTGCAQSQSNRHTASDLSTAVCRNAGLSAWHGSAYGKDADYSEYNLDQTDDGLRYNCEATINMAQDRQPVSRQKEQEPFAPLNNPYDLPQL